MIIEESQNCAELLTRRKSCDIEVKRMLSHKMCPATHAWFVMIVCLFMFVYLGREKLYSALMTQIQLT